MSSGPRRWELTREEWEQVEAARRVSISARAAARLLLRSPRLIPEVVRDLVAHAKQGLWQSSALVWTLDGERIRTIVPDAARGIAFTDLEPFLGILRPRLDPGARVLDCGGGDGRISRVVAPHVRELVCSDVSRAFTMDRPELRAHQLERVRLAAG